MSNLWLAFLCMWALEAPLAVWLLRCTIFVLFFLSLMFCIDSSCFLFNAAFVPYCCPSFFAYASNDNALSSIVCRWECAICTSQVVQFRNCNISKKYLPYVVMYLPENETKYHENHRENSLQNSSERMQREF